MGLVTGNLDLVRAQGNGSILVDGDATQLGNLGGLIAPVDTALAIVTP